MRSTSDVKVRRFFKRNREIVIFAGTAIVFATFIVNEGLREHLKDAADSVSAENNVFVIREDMQMRQELGELDKNVQNKNESNRWLSDLHRVQTKSQRMYFSLGSVAYLIETTDDKEDLPAITELDKELTKIRFGSLALNISQAEVAAFEASASALELKLAAFQDEVMQHARLKLQHKHQQYELWTWVAYVLYGFGAALNLAGRICGVEVSGG